MFARKSNINSAMVLKVLGWPLMIEAVFMILPLLISLLYDEVSIAKEFLKAIIITGGVGALMAMCIRPKSVEMHKREGFLLTAMVWILFTVFGMLPFMFSGCINNVADAFFETMSGFTTTGATILSDVESVPKGLLFWRALIQWIGGMGIILFALAVIPMLNHAGGIQLFNAEVTGITHDKLRPRISQTAKGLWLVYIILSILMILLLWAGPMNLFDSVCHTFATLSTGGFSTSNSSVGGWNSYYIDSIVILFMFLGGTNFSLLYIAFHGKPKQLLKNNVFRAYLLVNIIATLLCFAGQYINNPNIDLTRGFMTSAFQVVSGFTSTGFVTDDFGAWGQFPLMILMLLMFICACAGSTTGGVKLDRVMVLMKHVKNEINHVLHPNLITTVRLNDKVVQYEAVQKIMAFLSIYVIILLLSVTIITIYGISCVDATFMTLSALGDVGYGYGVTKGGLYVTLPDLVKWIMSFDMLIGRLELFTVLILFTKGFWVK